MSLSTNRSLDRRDIRLPGSVAEVDASPHGPKVGAFFDLDGTLVAGFTGVIMTQDRMRRREIGVGEFLGVVQAALNHQLGRADFEQLIYRGASMMRGRSLEDIDELGERLFVQHVVSRIYPEMRELVRAHMARGHTVVLSSSALTVQVDPVARFLGIDKVLSNRFETDDDGILTGGVLKPIIWGPGKANAVQKFAADNDVDLRKSYFYADGDEDVALMYLVGNPRPTNPEGKLAAVAAKRGWPILRFSSRSGSSPVSAARRQQAARRQLLHVQLGLVNPRGNRRASQRDRRGEPDRRAACRVHLQPPQPGGSGYRWRTGARQLHLGGQEGTREEPDHGYPRQGDGCGVHRP
jgi:putative phosphoserine phosphatase/1-acylglycerol-3-phosphate O-acyltransferase